MERGLFFKTKNDNTYYFNDITGEVNFVGEIDKNIVSEKKIELNDTSKEFINEEEIAEYLKKNGFSQLVLMITEECNLRCKYCVYSEDYKSTRNHGENKMSINTAKKAVKKYLENFKEVKYKNPFLIPRIGFYGGEPLLEYDLIKEVVEYCNEIYENDIAFNISTNSILLNDKIIDFLAENKFYLSISLNGDKLENDRLRIFENGKGSFDIILKKLLKIRESYPDYYREYCSILITFDTGTDLKRLNQFISENDSILPSIARINPVSSVCTDWYDQYSDEQKQAYLEDFNYLKKLYKDQIKKGKVDTMLLHLFQMPYFSLLNRIINVESKLYRPRFMKYTGACIPGVKIAVDTYGNIHCCERVGEKNPIGNVDEWINYKKIIKLISNYNKAVTKECNECPIQRLCDYCYCHFINSEEGFQENTRENCNKAIEYNRELLSELWGLLEDGVDIGNIFD